jgi:hypothetical protein
LKTHALSCDYCQKRLAGVWSEECPGWKVLQTYLQEGHAYPDRLAIERHLEWTGCTACDARLKFLKLPKQPIEWTGDWLVMILNTSAEASISTADIPLPINAAVEEDNGSIVVQLTSKDPTLAGKVFDFRLAGERFESRCELTLKSVDDEEWRATIAIPLSEEHLRDLSGKRLISFRICEELDQADNEFRSSIKNSEESLPPAPAILPANSSKITVLRSGKKPSTIKPQALAIAAQAHTERGWPLEVEINLTSGGTPVQLRFHLTARHIAVELADPNERRRIRLTAREIPIDACYVTTQRKLFASAELFKLHGQSTEAEIKQALLIAGLEVQVE